MFTKLTEFFRNQMRGDKKLSLPKHAIQEEDHVTTQELRRMREEVWTMIDKTYPVIETTIVLENHLKTEGARSYFENFIGIVPFQLRVYEIPASRIRQVHKDVSHLQAAIDFIDSGLSIDSIGDEMPEFMEQLVYYVAFLEEVERRGHIDQEWIDDTLKADFRA